jgi:hypothetical protein
MHHAVVTVDPLNMESNAAKSLKSTLSVAAHMAAETEHVIGLLPEIKEKHCIQIKNTHNSCIYLTCVLYFFNKLNLKSLFIFYFLKMGCRVSEKIYSI